MLALQKETTAPYDLSVMCKDEPRLQPSEFPGVDKMSPVRRIQAQLSVEDYSQSIEIQGVFSSFLELSFIEGGSFQDNTYMPFLVMNEAAAKAFTKENSDDVREVDTNTVLTMKGLGEAQQARVIGIYRDGSETPVCYMSYDTASRDQEAPEQLEYLFHLQHKGDAAKIAKLLSKRHLNAVLDQNELQRWELMRSQVWQYVITAAAGLCCGYVMIWKQHKNNVLQEKEEYMGMLASGLTMREIQGVFPLRIFLVSGVSILLAVCISLVSSLQHA